MFKLWLKMTAAAAAATVITIGVCWAAGPRANLLLISALCFSACAAGLGAYTALCLKPRFEKIQKACDALGREDFSWESPATGRDALGGVGAALQRAAEQLAMLREETTRRHAAETEAAVAARTAAIEESNRQSAEIAADARRLDKMKTQMSMVVYHDLRSPLAAIQSCLSVVAEGIVGEINPKQKDMLRRADEDIDKLLSLIADLLVLSLSQIDIDEKSRDVRPLDAAKILARVIAAYKPRAEQKGLTLEAEAPATLPAIHGDKGQIDQVFSNIVGNAVKYTKTGTVRVIAFAAGGRLTVTVADTGIGIPPEDLEKVFEAFYRTPEAKAVEKVGSGLGLSIVKRIVETHGGAITAQSQPGKGSVFTITLPCEKE